jgi:hypothetical protein
MLSVKMKNEKKSKCVPITQSRHADAMHMTKVTNSPFGKRGHVMKQFFNQAICLVILIFFLESQPSG